MIIRRLPPKKVVPILSVALLAGLLCLTAAAEEYTVSRLFVDARVLSIFEGADETLCLKVIARQLVASARS